LAVCIGEGEWLGSLTAECAYTTTISTTALEGHYLLEECASYKLRAVSDSLHVPAVPSHAAADGAGATPRHVICINAKDLCCRAHALQGIWQSVCTEPTGCDSEC
jgi:hypothetical protein